MEVLLPAAAGALLGTSGRRGIILWACSQVFQRSDCSQVVGLMQLSKLLDSPQNLLKKQQAGHDQLRHQVLQFTHKAADLYNIPPTTNSLACVQQQQKKKKTGTDISRIVFGIAASETWAHGGQREYVKQGWKPEMRGFVWQEK